MKSLNVFLLAITVVVVAMGSTQALAVTLPGLTTGDIVEIGGDGITTFNEGSVDTFAGLDGNNNVGFNSAAWTYTNNPAVNENDWTLAVNDGSTDPGPFDMIGFTSGTMTHVSSVLMAENTTYTFSVDLSSGTGTDTTDDWDISIGANGVTQASLSDTAVPDLPSFGFDSDNVTVTHSVLFFSGATAPAGTSFGDPIEVSINAGGANNLFVFIAARNDTIQLDSFAGELNATVNRSTGEIAFTNTTDSPIENIIGYSILSDAGSLDQTSWDKQSVGASQLADDDDDWTVLTGGGVTTDLSEAVLGTTGAGDGGDLQAVTGAWSFGNVWTPSLFEDVVIELLLDNGSVISSADSVFPISYEGGNAFHLADLTGNGAVDSLDWQAFKAAFNSGDVSGLTSLAAYKSGDINADGASDYDDFLAYRNAYDDANGEGAFAAMIASVPEPSSLLLLAFGGLALMFRRR